jgi:hypothetical protein
VTIFAMGGPLAGCGDFIDNAIGLNGNSNWNVPMQIQGAWSGYLSMPAITNRSRNPILDCLKVRVDDVTAADYPHMTLSIDGEKVTGTVTFADGARFDVAGKTGTGAWHSGHNLLFADIFSAGRRVGSFSAEPDGFSGRLAGQPWLVRPDTRAFCTFSVTLERDS